MNNIILKDRTATHFTSVLKDGKSPYSGKTREEYIAEGYIAVSLDEAMKIVDENEEKLYIKPWTEITESRWWQSLEELPPVRYQSVDGIEFFFCSEAYSGNIHTCYCNINDKYYSAMRRLTTSYANMIVELKEQNYV